MGIPAPTAADAVDPGARTDIVAVPLFLLVALSACGEREARFTRTSEDGVEVVENEASGVLDLDSAWSAAVETRVGSRRGAGPESFGQVVDLTVDGLGRIWVLDRQAKEVRVFGRDGDFVRRVGGEGQGPGEFTDPIGVDVGPDGGIWVLDPGNSRISVFDTTGEHRNQYRRVTGEVSGYNMAWRGGFDAQGRYWDLAATGAGEWSWTVSRPGSTLVAVDTVPVPEREGGREQFEWTAGGGRYRASVPFTPSAAWDVAPEGTRVMSPGSPYEIRWLEPEGGVELIARKAWDPVAVTEGDRERALERLDWVREQGGTIDPSRIPDEKPAVRALFVEPSGRVWIDPYDEGESNSGRTFDVFAPDGRYLGPFTLPVAIDTRPRPVFRGDRVYAVHEDEVGVDHVVVLRLDRPSADAP